MHNSKHTAPKCQKFKIGISNVYSTFNCNSQHYNILTQCVRRRLLLNGQPEHRNHAVDGLVLPLDRAAPVGHGVPHARACGVQSSSNFLHQDASHCTGETQFVGVGELNIPSDHILTYRCTCKAIATLSRPLASARWPCSSTRSPDPCCNARPWDWTLSIPWPSSILLWGKRPAENGKEIRLSTHPNPPQLQKKIYWWNYTTKLLTQGWASYRAAVTWISYSSYFGL